MQYYMIEWENEEADEPYQLFLEMDDQGCLLRKIEGYRVGFFQRTRELRSRPMDPRELAGDSGHLSSLTGSQFENLWEQVRDLPNAFTGMFF